MPELRVPFAFDDEEQIHTPENAEKGRTYFCPACREPVILKQGEIKTAHFAHKVSESCNQESIIHKTAKLLVQKAVEAWKAGKSESPTLLRKCQICGKSVNQTLPEKIESATLEYKLSDGSIVDVALLVEGVPQAAVEIRATHAVDDIKAKRLSVPFIELDANEVIQNPTLWNPIKDNFKPLVCSQCRSTWLRFQAKAKQIAQATNVELPTAYYRYGIHKCWKCKREILVFTWPSGEDKAPVLFENQAPKLKPIPRTIQYRFSKMAGTTYWVNTCPYCKAIQGDFFLNMEPDGAFFGVHCVDDSPTAFENDMLRIAAHAARNELI